MIISGAAAMVGADFDKEDWDDLLKGEDALYVNDKSECDMAYTML